MKKTLLPLVLSLFLLLSACTITDPAVSQPPPAETVTPTTAPQEPAATPAPAATQNPKDAALEQITAGIAETMGDAAYTVAYDGKGISLKMADQSITDAVAAGLSAGTTPDNWADTVSAVEEIGKALATASDTAGAGDGPFTVYVQSEVDGGDIYLTVVGGKVMYSVFDEKVKPKNEPTISLEEYNKIESGMTYQDIVNIIGSQGNVLSDVDIGDEAYHTIMYSWDGEGSLGANANVTIQGGKVVAKAQFGLE